jgi:hypothetical protein
MSKSTPSNNSLPPGHVRIPAAAIGALSLVLAVGLNSLGFLERLDEQFAGWLSNGLEFPKRLSVWVVWLVALVFAFGISFSLLSVTATWRRLVIWITSLVLLVGWAPVLVLAAHAPDIAVPLVTVAWSGICALVYASRHEMPSDQIFPVSATLPQQSTHEAR